MMTDDQWNGMMGTVQEYYIKEDKYKSVTNGTYAQFMTFVPSENRLYAKFSSADTLYWFDVTVGNSEVERTEFIKTNERILGMKCKILVLYTSKGKETYYYNKHLKADPLYFQKHRFANWSTVVSRTHALPLKVILESEQFNLTSTAVEIEETELEDAFFELPDLPKKVSPFEN